MKETILKDSKMITNGACDHSTQIQEKLIELTNSLKDPSIWLYTLSKFSQLLNVNESTCEDLRSRGELPFITVDGDIWYYLRRGEKIS